MEMKDAPLVQEEIASSKVKSLRKVAITVAVVALTVCGVAVGMVAAGMESKNVPTLKYTPGTKTVFNHSVQTFVGSDGDMNMEPNTLAVEQYVLNIDATGATTFLINIPVAFAVIEEDSSSADSTPIASFVVTQAANGVVDYSDIKTNVPMESEFYNQAGQMLVHHMSMVSPRLAQDATVSEVDAVIGKQVDAKYTVNNLEQGATEVVRTVAPAGVANQVNGQQLYAASSKTVTIKDGEVVAAKSTGASEVSAYFEKKGTSEGEVGYYRDSRQTYTHDSTMTKASTEAFNLAEFAAELESFTSADFLIFVETEYEAKAPFVVGTGMTGEGEDDSAPDEEESEEETRSLLGTSTLYEKKNDASSGGNNFTFKVQLGFTYSGPGGSKTCEQRLDTYYNKCSAKRGFELVFTVSLEVGGGSFTFVLAWGKTKETNPGNNVKKISGWKCYIKVGFKGFSVTKWLLRRTSTTNKNCDVDGPEVGTPSVPVPGLSIGPFGLKYKVYFEMGWNISPSIQPAVSKTSGYGCVKKNSSYTAKRYRNTQGAYNYMNSKQWSYLPETWQWDSKAYPTMFGLMKSSKFRKYRYYVQLNSNFYTNSGCTIKYSTSRTRFKVFATFMAFTEIGATVDLSTSCVGWSKLARKYEAGVRITGRFWSISITGGFYLLIGAGDCWYLTYAQNAATLTVALFFNKKYHKKCKKTKKLFKSIISKFKKVWTAKQSISDHMAFWKYPWLIYPCSSSDSANCNPKSNGFVKMFIYSGACSSDNYMLEPHYGGRKQFYTYK